MDRKTDAWHGGLTNLKWVTKTCKHCGKEFDTDTPWRKHCSWPCTYDHMQDLKRARRKAERERSKGMYHCIGCKGLVEAVAVSTAGRNKGICGGCMEVIEKLGFDKSLAYRLGYVIQTVFNKAPRQGRAEGTK